MTAVLADDQVWRRSAACSPATAEWFWLTPGRPEAGHRTRLSIDNKAALALCRSCPVLDDCLAYEEAHPDRWSYIAAGRLWPEGVGL